MDLEVNKTDLERDACKHFMGLKRMYSNQREELEDQWKECWDAYYNSPNMSRIYEGFSNIRIPTIDSKVQHILGRTESILFNVTRIGRIEPTNTATVNKMLVEAMNRYQFEEQMKDIKFKTEYHQFNLQKVVLGSSVAKITQEYATGSVEYTEGNIQEYTIKDNTYFKPLVLNEFYSDASKPCIYESQANIHSTLIPYTELDNNRKRFIQEGVISIDNGQEVVMYSEKEVGIYDNVDRVDPSYGMTQETEDYLQRLGMSESQIASFTTYVEEGKKTGSVRVDECYGMFDLGTGPIEVICVIANESIVLRLEPTPFKHKRYVRPFIFGKYKPKLGLLYGESNVYKTLPMLKELNSARSQMTDARSFSVFPMIQVNKNNIVNWDGKFTPMGIVEANTSQPAITFIAQPNLSNNAISDIQMILRDIDELWAISPIQQGTSDNRLIPGTGIQTMALIAQNDFVLDMVISDAIENEFMPFFEMLMERNFTFKSPADILKVLTMHELSQLNPEDFESMDSLVFDATISICGSTQLAYEQATRQGYQMLLGLAQQIPNLARRIDYPALTNKLLASFGIKDDAQEILLPEEDVQAVMYEENKGQQEQMLQEMQQMQAQLQELLAENNAMREKIANKPVEDLQIHQIKGQMDLQKATMEEQMRTEELSKRKMAEATIQLQTGQKVS